MRLNLQFYLGIGPALTRESWQRVKVTIRKRDHEVCQYCGEPAPDGEPDHILPLSRGGTDQLTNLVWACQECNRSKGDKTLREWLDILHKTSVSWLETDNIAFSQMADETQLAAITGLTGIRILSQLDQAEAEGLLSLGQLETIETAWREAEE